MITHAQVRLGRDSVLLNKTVHLVPGMPSLTLHEVLPCPSERSAAAVLTASIVNEHGQYFEDAISVTFHANFELVLKWITLLPFAVGVAAVALASLTSSAPLPI